MSVRLNTSSTDSVVSTPAASVFALARPLSEGSHTNARAFSEKVDGHFGQRGGCLFYEVGCRGPMTHASCNRILWNRHSSKTRSNHPCLGCTEPGFPHHDLKKGSIFKTMHYLGFLPKEIPVGDNMLSYYFKAGVGKVFGSPNKTFETTK